jgi:hypothetical protein
VLRLSPLCLAAALTLLFVPAAAAHGPANSGSGYTSTVSNLRPSVLGLMPTVLGGDDRLRVVNYSGKTIVVSGYDGEPFLRFTKDGVYENTRSPATYLSRERDPERARVPATADASAPPRWQKIAAATQSVVWHDHRIHWTKKSPPPVVAEAPDETHKIFDWEIPASADGQPFEIVGFLGYRPPPPAAGPSSGSGTSPWLVGGVVALSVLALGGLAVGARRATRAPTS